MPANDTPQISARTAIHRNDSALNGGLKRTGAIFIWKVLAQSSTVTTAGRIMCDTARNCLGIYSSVFNVRVGVAFLWQP